jgi:hypothetical protein
MQSATIHDDGRRMRLAVFGDSQDDTQVVGTCSKTPASINRRTC